MFCKNARTKLAMANDTPMPAEAAAVPEAAAAPAERPAQPITQSVQNIPLALLAAISKEPEQHHQQQQETRKFDFTGSSLQLLQRQLQLLQEEQAQRLYMYRLALANQTAVPRVAPPQQTQQAAGIQQMQQLMQLRERQRKGLVPRNGRASAA